MKPEFRVALLLADSSLELVPKELAGHPSVRKASRRRGRSPLTTLLDKSIHYHAMKRLRNQEKRGRPDIVHLCMLEALESLLCSGGFMQLYVHTLHSLVVKVRSDVRLPKNYNRFVGLMEQLLLRGRVPGEGEALLEVIGRGIGRAVEDFKPSKKLLLSEEGRFKAPLRLAEELASEERPMIIVGAFPHGDFSKEVKSVADDEVSLCREVLESFTAVSAVTRALEFTLNLYKAE
ncbi:MAG: 16S rRNA methyltransferase [Candidatus Nezhaarchaeota archaeon]|nr:16S rRNA methyltransferase [Candidatus Nezhaarchaeota archaeon]